MAVLGRWTGGVQSQGNLPEAWTAPNGLFPTEARNDTSFYSWASATSTITLPSTGLADGYLFIGYYQYEDTSNGRLNPQGKVVQASGTGTFVGGPSAGYNRDNSEDRSYVRCWAIVDSPSASSTYQFQWKADTDDSTGGTVESVFEVIPLYYADIGLYTSTSSALYGGTTPNQVTGFAGTDGTNITIASDTVTVTGDNKRYLAFGSQFFEGRGGRTQRWHGMLIDGSKDDAAKAYSYYRNTANDESGEIFTQLIETSTASRTIGQFCYRGDGVTAGQGGADIDGSTPSVGDHALVVIELNDSAEVFQSIDGTGGVDLNVTGPVDISLCRTVDIGLNDSASFTRASDSAMNATVAMDGLFGANLSAAQEVVAVTSRWTAFGRFTVNGTDDDETRAGDYARNNQGSTDTFGWSANLLSYVSLSADDDIGASIQELSGGEDGGQYEIQPGWGGFWGINLDTLEGGAGSFTLVMQDSAHTQAADNLTLSESATLSIAEPTHAQSVESFALTQSYTLGVNEALHGQSVDNLALTQSVSLAPSDSSHSHFADAVSLTQAYILTMAQADQAILVDPVTMTQANTLLVAETTHGHIADPVSITQAYLLTVSDTESGQAVGPVTLSQSALIEISEATQAQTADNIALTQGYILSLADALQASLADGISLSQSVGLLVADSSSSQTSDALTLNQASTLSVSDGLQSVAVQAINLSQGAVLDLQEAIQSVLVDPVTLSSAASLSVSSGLHNHSVDNLVLLQDSVLSPQDTLSVHSVDNVELSQSVALVTASALHGHSVDGLELTQASILNIASAVHQCTVDGLQLNQAATLIVSEALHSVLSANLEFGPYLNPTERLLVISGLDRTFLVSPHSFTFNVEF